MGANTWNTTLPQDAGPAVQQGLVGLAKDMTPVEGQRRSALRSAQEWENAQQQFQEGQYPEAAASTIWSGLESADAALPALGALGTLASAPIDVARLAKNALNKTRTTPAGLLPMPETFGMKQPPGVLLDRPPEVTGSFKYGSDVPLTFQGKEPSNWTGEDFHNFGKTFGVDDFGPKNQKDWLNSIVEYKMRDGSTLKIPGGIDGKFTYYDMHFINSQGIDIGPEWFTPGNKSMFKKPTDYWKIHDKMMRSVQPSQKQMTDQQIFTQFMFGLTSPQNKLTPNLMAVGKVRATSMKDIKDFGEMVPWKYDDFNADRVFNDAGFTGTPYQAPNPNKGIPGRESTIRGPDGELVTSADGTPIKKNKEEAIRAYYSKKAGSKLGIGKGQLGFVGTQDYSRIAEFAQMFKDKPKWFRKSSKETWVEYSERISTQIDGLSFKTSSFSGVWQDTMGAQVAPVDRHIVVLWLRNSNSSGANASKKFLVDKWNRDIASGNPPIQTAQPVRDFVDLQSQPGSYSYIGNVGLNQAKKQAPGSKTKKRMIYRRANGKINPDIPNYLKKVKWIKEPKYVESMPDNYKEALDTVASIAGKGRGMYNQQWGAWDPMRHRLSPHEAMFPGLQYLPRMNLDQFMSVREVYKKHGFLGPGRTLAKKGEPQKRLPKGVEVDPKFGPTRQVPGGPSQLAYWGLIPPAIAAPLLYDERNQ